MLLPQEKAQLSSVLGAANVRGWTHQALVGTKGGFMTKERGGRKQQKKVKQGMKVIKGGKTGQRAKAQGRSSLPPLLRSLWCDSYPRLHGHALQLG